MEPGHIATVATLLLAVAAAAGWAAAFALRQVLETARLEVVQLKAAQPAAAAATEPAPAPPAPSRWRALPGERLELEDSGFYIVLAVQPATHYLLFAPEHTLVAHGVQLPMLKAYGEQLAAERLEFAPPPALAPFWRAFK